MPIHLQEGAMNSSAKSLPIAARIRASLAFLGCSVIILLLEMACAPFFLVTACGSLAVGGGSVEVPSRLYWKERNVSDRQIIAHILPECDYLCTYLYAIKHECLGFWKFSKKFEL